MVSLYVHIHTWWSHWVSYCTTTDHSVYMNTMKLPGQRKWWTSNPSTNMWDATNMPWKALLDTACHSFNERAGETMCYSGRFRNLERGFSHWHTKPTRKFWGVPHPLPVTWMHHVQTEYLEATLGLVKPPEISKELICKCVSVPGCCCCIPLLYNHLMDLCS